MKKLDKRSLVIAIAAALMLAACGKTAEQSLDSAKALLAKQDAAAAIIELKNALQAQPDLPEARLLLGQALLERGDAVGAVVELEKARALKVSGDRVLPLLAQALLQSGQARKVIELGQAAAVTTPEAAASLKTSLALAYSREGDADKADAALSAALEAKPDHRPALLLRARRLAIGRDFDGAMKVVEEVLARAPADADALALKGDLLQLARKDVAGAEESYRKALAAAPGHLGANTALISALLGRRDLAAAGKQLEAFRNARPGRPEVLYFQARLAAQSGDTKLASEAAQQLLKAMPDSPLVLELAGVVALQGGELSQAEQHMDRVVQLVPGLAAPRRMLAQIRMRMGDPPGALAILEPLIDASSDDSRALLLAGEAKALSGDMAEASGYFSRAAKANPSDARSRTALALTRLARGDMGGFGDLESIASADSGTIADLALVSLHATRGEFDAAMRAVDKLQKKQPGGPQAAHLRGGILALKGDLAGARASYEQALAADPKFFPAVSALSVLDLREKKPDQARQRMESVLNADPNDVRAMVAIASLDDRAGKPKEAVAALLAKAVAAKPGDPRLRRRQVEYLAGKRDFKAALEAAQQAASALPNDPDVLELLAASQLAVGDTNRAISSYGRLVSLRPKSPQALLGLVNAQLAAKAGPDAAETMRKAQALAPDSDVVLRTAIDVDLLNKQPDAALAKARKLQARHPKSAFGFVAEGDVEATRGRWSAAVAGYRAALQREASSMVAQRLHFALLRAGDAARTDAFVSEWTRAHPGDAAFMLSVANAAIGEKAYARAETQLTRVLQVTPDNAVALNNLAWVLATQKKRGAVGYAERANALAPDQPAFLDTLAQSLASEGDLSRALEVQKRAVLLAPDAHELRLHLAQLLLEAGDTAAARKEAGVLAELGDKFPQRAALRELQKRL